MTSSQYNQFKDHPNLVWLRYEAGKNHAVHQAIVKAKISEAIKSKFPDRATDENIRWVAQDVGMPWGDVFKPPEFTEGLVHRDAVRQIVGRDAKMAQALRMVFKNTADGRSAPGTSNVNHIHVGGIGTKNLLFDSRTRTVLGVIDAHMDRGMRDSITNLARDCELRRGGPTVRVRVTAEANVEEV